MATKLLIGASAMAAAAAAQDSFGASEPALVTERIRRLGTQHVDFHALDTIRDWMERVNPELLPYDVEERRRSGLNGEEYCESPDMIRNAEACKASSCCHWNTWEAGHASFNGEGRCWSDIGQDTCKGKAAPTGTPAPALKRDLTPGSWTMIDHGCINGNNLKKYTGKSLDECKALCMKDPKCQSVEYGANHKENAEFKPKDCQLNSSRDPANCDGGAENIDLYLAPRVPIDVDAIETPTLNDEQKEHLEKMNGLLGEFKGVVGSPEYCWRGSYTRDAGRFGSECPSDKERVGLIGLWCYDKCPKGYSRIRVDGVPLDATCYQDCPDGFIDSGVSCTILDMEDDFGYLREQKCHNLFYGEWPWEPTKGPLGRCEKKYGKGNCEFTGLVSPTGQCFAPKCNSAPEKHVVYKSVGPWCRPTVDCPSMDMIDGFQITGKTCTKQPPQLWPGIETTGCASGTERDGALCYNPCKSGFKGNAFVCWEQAPKGWEECGMGAAKDKWTCASVTGGQVFAVGQLVYTIGSMGAGALGNTAANAANPGLIQQAKDLVVALKEWLQISKEMEQVASTVMEVGGVAWNAHSAASHDLFQTEEDVVRFIAKVTKIFDGTGISSTIAAYTYPQCSKYGLEG